MKSNDEIHAIEKDLDNRVKSLKRMSEELINQRRLRDEIYNSSNTAIIIWRLSGEVIEFNNYFSEMLGWGDEYIGKHWIDFLIPKSERESMVELIKQL